MTLNLAHRLLPPCLALLLAACASAPAAPVRPAPPILPWVLQEPAYVAAAVTKLAYVRQAAPQAYHEILRTEAFYRTQPMFRQLSARERMAAAVHVYEVAHGIIVPIHPSQYLAP